MPVPQSSKPFVADNTLGLNSPGFDKADMIINGRKHRLQDLLFQGIHSRGLIYNTCWEDPRIDRALLQLQQDSRVVMITSAGCNALDYLLDNPKALHCIDMNFRQNALLYLRMAMIKVLAYPDFFAIFANGSHTITESMWQEIYQELPDFAVKFWKKKRHYFFSKNKVRPSFYYHGTAGTLAWIFMGYMRKIQPKVYQKALDLLEARSLEEQKQIYQRIEPRLWNRFSRWFVRQPALMSLLGVPRAQARLIDQDFPGGLSQYVRLKLKYVLTEVPIQDNYFWLKNGGTFLPAADQEAASCSAQPDRLSDFCPDSSGTS
jgi:S-adenosylmethionine-diacylglycerol 3-amino-3-carboxypropyl transferase